jgi:hypothetical protein
MKTYINAFGRPIDMTSQARRRRFIVLFYAAFAVLEALAWLWSPNGSEATTVMLVFTFLLGPLLGGYLSHSQNVRSEDRGLVKPFEGNQLLRLSQRGWLKISDPKEFRNDERDLTRRDRAHYRAYGVLAGIITVALILFDPPVYHAIPAVTEQRIVFALLQAGYLLAFTLPAAIIIWTEPDLEPDLRDPAEPNAVKANS